MRNQSIGKYLCQCSLGELRHLPASIPRMLSATIVLFFLWMVSYAEERPPSLVAQEGGFSLSVPVVFTQIPARHGTMQSEIPPLRRLAGGSRIVLLDSRQPSKNVEILTRDFFAAGSPDISFDGRRMLFIGKRREEDSLGVWEMELSWHTVRPIVQLATDCIEARYLSTIFTLEATSPEYLICLSNIGADGIGALYTCHMDGTRLRRITFFPDGANHPFQLGDGRLVFSAPTVVEGKARATSRPEKEPRTADCSMLYTVNIDGTDISAFTSTLETPADQTMPCEASDGRVFFVEAARQAGAGTSILFVSRNRSLHSRQTLASMAGGNFCSISSTPDGHLLIGYRAAGAATSGILAMRGEHHAPLVPVFDSADYDEVQAMAVCERPEPAGRSSVVDDQADFGYLYGLNSYLSDTKAGTAIVPGQIKRVEVLKALDSGGRENGTAPARPLNHDPDQSSAASLGLAPVESDGSFFLRVPARTALRLRTLDAQGNTLQSMQSWIWVMPREGRGCIGCHEDRNLSPPNRHVLALRVPPRAVGVAEEPPAKDHTSRQSTHANRPAAEIRRGEP